MLMDVNVNLLLNGSVVWSSLATSWQKKKDVKTETHMSANGKASIIDVWINERFAIPSNFCNIQSKSDGFLDLYE